jgi:hypothetical protein
MLNSRFSTLKEENAGTVFGKDGSSIFGFSR